MLLKAAIIGLCLAGPAQAEITQWCVEAIKDGRTEYVATAAEIILTQPRPYTPEEGERGATCVSSAKGESYVYKSGRFLTEERHEEVVMRETAVAAVEQRDKARTAEVVTRLIDGCEAKYRRDADEAITNKLCFDVFMERGLPE